MRTLGPLIALTVLACVLRLWGIDHCVPHSKEADAHMALHVELIRAGSTEPDPHHNDAQYPILLPGLISLLPDTTPAPAPTEPLSSHLAAAARAYVETRTVLALIGVLMVPLTFLFARRFLPAGWSLFAAALVATSFLHQFFAQQARPHAAASSVFLLAVLAAMRVARAPTGRSYVLAALAAVASIGTLQSGLAVLPPLALALLIASIRRVHEPARKLAARIACALVLPLAACAAAIALCYPYLYFEGREAAYGSPRIEGTRLTWGDHTFQLSDWQGRGFVTLARTLVFYEPLMLALLGVAAIVFVARRGAAERALERWSDLWVAASFAVPYLIAVGLFRNSFERFLLPLLPYLAVCAAWGLWRASEKLGAYARRAVVALAVFALALPASTSARLAWVRSGDDTLERTAHWLAAQPDAMATPIYITPFFDLPLPRSRASLEPPDGRPKAILSRWSIHQARRGADAQPVPQFDLRYLVPRPDLGFPGARLEADAEGYVRALGPGYYVLDMSRQPARPGLDHVRAAVQHLGTRVFRVAPETDGPTSAFGFPFEDELLPDWPNVLLRSLRIDAVGQVVEVYRIP